jgi:uncharacterized phiE125 gp8 family phage protein
LRQGTLVNAPTEEPIDLAVLKQHMKVTITDDDVLITTYLTAARQYVEEAYDRALVTQTWDYSLDTFPWLNQSIELPIWPLQSVTSITYTDSNNTPTIWASNNYFVDAVKKPGRVWLAANQGWPAAQLRAANGVVIRYVAGYGAATAVPYTTRMAIMLLVEHWYEFREPIMAQRGVTPIEVPFTVRNLLSMTEVAGVS